MGVFRSVKNRARRMRRAGDQGLVTPGLSAAGTAQRNVFPAAPKDGFTAVRKIPTNSASAHEYAMRLTYSLRPHIDVAALPSSDQDFRPSVTHQVPGQWHIVGDHRDDVTARRHRREIETPADVRLYGETSVEHHRDVRRTGLTGVAAAIVVGIEIDHPRDFTGRCSRRPAERREVQAG